MPDVQALDIRVSFTVARVHCTEVLSSEVPRYMYRFLIGQYWIPVFETPVAIRLSSPVTRATCSQSTVLLSLSQASI